MAVSILCGAQHKNRQAFLKKMIKVLYWNCSNTEKLKRQTMPAMINTVYYLTGVSKQIHMGKKSMHLPSLQALSSAAVSGSCCSVTTSMPCDWRQCPVAASVSWLPETCKVCHILYYVHVCLFIDKTVSTLWGKNPIRIKLVHRRVTLLFKHHRPARPGTLPAWWVDDSLNIVWGTA